MPPMVKTAIRTAADAGRTIVSSFGAGLASAVSVTGGPHRPFPRIEGDPNRAFAKDWGKLGGDMHRAVEKVAPRGSKG